MNQNSHCTWLNKRGLANLASRPPAGIKPGPRAGNAALKKAPKAGRPSRLKPADLPALKHALQAGPGEHGFPTELWTTQRIAQVIKTRFGVTYHPDHVGRLLGQIGWSCQRPTTRAIQRDEPAIRKWKQSTWPRLKKKP